MTGVWRTPNDETVYPAFGMVVHDGRVTGSITAGPTRLPLWALPAELVTEATWKYIVDEYEPAISRDQFVMFLICLLEMRGEFARLLLELADAERAEYARGHRSRPWWTVPTRRKRIARQLRRCLALMEDDR